LAVKNDCLKELLKMMATNQHNKYAVNIIKKHKLNMKDFPEVITRS